MTSAVPCGVPPRSVVNRTVLAGLVASTVLSGCGGDAEAGSSWTHTVDTLASGVVRVVNSPPADAEPGYVLEQELRIGTVGGEGPAQFGQLKGIAALSDGRIAVLDAMARELRIFDATGAHLATYGGQGAGPGELEAPWGLMRDDGDRLWVPDHRNRRMTVFHPDSGPVATYPFPVMRYGFTWGGAMLDDGRIAKPSIRLRPERRDMLRVFNAEMELVDSILEPVRERPTDPRDYPGRFVFEDSDGLLRGSMSVPFYPQTQRHIAASGHIWTSEGHEPVYRIIRTDLHGDTSLIIETARPLIPIPDSTRDQVIEGLRARMKESGWGTDHDWSKVPHVYPPVTQLFDSDGGELWVRTASPDSLQRFDIYRPNGVYRRTVVTALLMPPFVAPIVRGDRVWTLVQDEMGVPYVVRARIRERGRGAAG